MGRRNLLICIPAIFSSESVLGGYMMEEADVGVGVIPPTRVEALQALICATAVASSVCSREGWIRVLECSLVLLSKACTAVAALQDLLVDLSVSPRLQIRWLLGFHERLLKIGLLFCSLSLQLLAQLLVGCVEPGLDMRKLRITVLS